MHSLGPININLDAGRGSHHDITDKSQSSQLGQYMVMGGQAATETSAMMHRNTGDLGPQTTSSALSNYSAAARGNSYTPILDRDQLAAKSINVPRNE